MVIKALKGRWVQGLETSRRGWLKQQISPMLVVNTVATAWVEPSLRGTSPRNAPYEALWSFGLLSLPTDE